MACVALAAGAPASAQMAGPGRDAFLKDPATSFVLENARPNSWASAIVSARSRPARRPTC